MAPYKPWLQWAKQILQVGNLRFAIDGSVILHCKADATSMVATTKVTTFEGYNGSNATWRSFVTLVPMIIEVVLKASGEGLLDQ